MENNTCSVVIPSYNEEEMIQKTSHIVGSVLENASIPYEIVFVDDGSKDKTWDEIVLESGRSGRVRGVHFSRNFGKESAIYAGLSAAEGGCCVVMDCDLQHPPEKIAEMYRLWQQGYEIVEGIKASRGQETFIHAMAAKAFYRIISSAAGVDMSRASDFKLLDHKAVLVLLNMQEKNAFFRALSSWIGFKGTQIEFDVQERAAGESKWSTKSLIDYAVKNITSFTAAPMQIITYLGIVTFAISMIFGITAFMQKLIGIALGGFTTVILLQLFSSSVIMISLGIIGYYISRIYEEVKGRPRYIVSATCGGDSAEGKVQ